MPIIDIPGVGKIAFPASMSPDEINNTIKNKVIPQARERQAAPGAIQSALEAASHVPGLGFMSTALGRGIAKGGLSTGTHVTDIARKTFGAQPLLDQPLYQEATTPRGLGETLGYGAEQTAEQVAAGLALPEIEGAGLVRGAARIGREALGAGAATGLQTGSWGGAAVGAGLGAFGGAVAETGRKLAPYFAKRALSPFSMNLGLQERKAIAQRVIRPGAPVPMTEKEVLAKFPSLEKEMSANKAEIELLTKDPNSPYSQKTVPIQRVMKPIRQYARRLERSTPGAGRVLEQDIDQWAWELGYRPPVTKRVVVGYRNQQPIYANVVLKPAQTETTIQQLQQLKEDFRLGIGEAARGEKAGGGAAGAPGSATAKRLAESSMRKRIQEIIPTYKQLNAVISEDLRVKEAVTAAVKRKPQMMKSIWHDIGVEFGLIFAQNLADAFTEQHPGLGGVSTIARIGQYVEPIALMIKLARRNPRFAMRLAMRLRDSGIKAPEIGTFLRSVAHGKPEPTSSAAPLAAMRMSSGEAGKSSRGPALVPVPALARAIERYEGGSAPGSRAQRNSNPGNLKVLPNQHLPGMIGRDPEGFAIFKDYDAGFTALKNQVERNVRRGMTLNEFFGGFASYPGYAPAADRNQPLQYAKTVGGWLGIDPNQPLQQARARAWPL